MFGQDTTVNPLAAGLMRYSSGMPFAVSGPSGPAGGGIDLGQGVTENAMSPLNVGMPVGAPAGGPTPIPGAMNTAGQPVPPVPLPPALANPMARPPVQMQDVSQTGNHQGQFGNQGQFGFGMNSAGQMY